MTSHARHHVSNHRKYNIFSRAFPSWQQRKPHAPHTSPLWGVSIDNWWVLPTKGRWSGKCHYVTRDVIISYGWVLSHPYVIAVMYGITNDAWVIVNNGFLARVRWFANDLHEWCSHEWKSLANHITSDQKSLFAVKNILFYFLHAILWSEHTIPLKTIIDRSFYHCRQEQSFPTLHYDVTTVDLWRHAN